MRYSELLIAAALVAAITAAYLTMTAAVGVPAAGGLVGHLMGVIGFTLMLLTETLYSLRKRAMRRPRGSMRSWLRVHIVMGIVGPYLVLLHTAWSFNGLAGALSLMTAIVVVSGFIGRYIYTAVPRTADGAVIEAQELTAQLTALREADAAGPSPTSDAARREHRATRATDPGAGAPAGRAALAAPGAGHVAHDPHPDRHGDVRGGVRAHRRGRLLRHAAAVAGDADETPTAGLHDLLGAGSPA